MLASREKKYIQLLLVIGFLLPWALIPTSNRIISKLYGKQYGSNDCLTHCYQYFIRKKEKYFYNNKSERKQIWKCLLYEKWSGSLPELKTDYPGC